MTMRSFLSGMMVLIIPSFFVCVLVGSMMYRRWKMDREGNP
jgi:hypothetical protein